MSRIRYNAVVHRADPARGNNPFCGAVNGCTLPDQDVTCKRCLATLGQAPRGKVWTGAYNGTRAATLDLTARVELVGNEIDDALAAVELALGEKRKAYETVKDQGFSERDFGIPQLRALEAKLERAQS